MLSKIVIKNYRVCHDFTLEFEPGLNILVGDNEMDFPRFRRRLSAWVERPGQGGSSAEIQPSA